MQKIVGVTELQRRFHSIFEEVTQENTPYVLTRGSRPEAAIISYEEYLRFQHLQEREILYRFDQLVTRMAEQNANVDEAEVNADVSATLNELE
jgi:prevent-host-death family protein